MAKVIAALSGSIKWKCRSVTEHRYPPCSSEKSCYCLMLCWSIRKKQLSLASDHPTACWIYLWALLLDFNFRIQLQAERKSINQTLFSTKSTTLISMALVDFVISRGETIHFFLEITKNSLYECNYENLGKMHRWRRKYKARYTFHKREIILAFLLQSVCIRDESLAFKYFTR